MNEEISRENGPAFTSDCTMLAIVSSFSVLRVSIILISPFVSIMSLIRHKGHPVRHFNALGVALLLANDNDLNLAIRLRQYCA